MERLRQTAVELSHTMAPSKTSGRREGTLWEDCLFRKIKENTSQASEGGECETPQTFPRGRRQRKLLQAPPPDVLPNDNRSVTLILTQAERNLPDLQAYARPFKISENQKVGGMCWVLHMAI